jgi:hypothetical protein
MEIKRIYATASERAVLYQYSFYQATNIIAGMFQTESPYIQPTRTRLHDGASPEAAVSAILASKSLFKHNLMYLQSISATDINSSSFEATGLVP